MERGLPLKYKTISGFNFENQPFDALMLAQGRPFDALMLACFELVEKLKAGLSTRLELLKRSYMFGPGS